MARKFFNTQMIIAGMPEEIREHFMGHKISNQVRDAYFLEDTEALENVYLQYMDNVTIGPVKPPVTMNEFIELKERLAEREGQLERMEQNQEDMNAQINILIENLNRKYKKKGKRVPSHIQEKKKILKSLQFADDEEDFEEDEY
jgi:hypothetical protein